jgi:predicted Zn-dependent protease
LYNELTPLADAIARTAQPRYIHPLKFYLVHEQQPNAFATPGGNVYVTDSLMYFVKDTEELAGTLCHEVSHTIHRDTMHLIEKERSVERREIGAAVILGPTRAHTLAIALLGKLRSLGYSRDAESAADLTGADVCAASAYNPWGLVWLFQDFESTDTAQVRSCCPITRTTSIGSTPSSVTSTKTRRDSRRFRTTSEPPDLSLCPGTRRWSSCADQDWRWY